jgi:lipase chaperone LimK
MKKIILFLAIMLSLNATKLFAQNGEKMQQAWKGYLKDSMQLADPMVDSVMAVRMQYQPQMREIFMDQSSSPADKQTKWQSLKSEMDMRYKSVGLTDDQIQAIHKHEDWMRSQMMNKMNNGGQ